MFLQSSLNVLVIHCPSPFSASSLQMGAPESPESPSGFVRVAQKVHHPIGFKKGYNFVLCKKPILRPIGYTCL